LNFVDRATIEDYHSRGRCALMLDAAEIKVCSKRTWSNEAR
jgi:hypothetical protein